MDNEQFEQAHASYGDTARINQKLFEVLSDIYWAFADNDFDNYQHYVGKLAELTKDNPTLVRVKAAFEVLADDGTTEAETMLASDLYHALDLGG